MHTGNERLWFAGANSYLWDGSRLTNVGQGRRCLSIGSGGSLAMRCAQRFALRCVKECFALLIAKWRAAARRSGLGQLRARSTVLQSGATEDQVNTETRSTGVTRCACAVARAHVHMVLQCHPSSHG
jgi:hypothetical protein